MTETTAAEVEEVEEAEEVEEVGEAAMVVTATAAAVLATAATAAVAAVAVVATVEWWRLRGHPTRRPATRTLLRSRPRSRPRTRSRHWRTTQKLLAGLGCRRGACHAFQLRSPTSTACGTSQRRVAFGENDGEEKGLAASSWPLRRAFPARPWPRVRTTWMARVPEALWDRVGVCDALRGSVACTGPTSKLVGRYAPGRG